MYRAHWEHLYKFKIHFHHHPQQHLVQTKNYNHKRLQLHCHLHRRQRHYLIDSMLKNLRHLTVKKNEKKNNKQIEFRFLSLI